MLGAQDTSSLLSLAAAMKLNSVAHSQSLAAAMKLNSVAHSQAALGSHLAETEPKAVPVPRTPDIAIAAIAIAAICRGGAGQTAPGGGFMLGHSNSFIVLCGCPTALFGVRELLDRSADQQNSVRFCWQ